MVREALGLLASEAGEPKSDRSDPQAHGVRTEDGAGAGEPAPVRREVGPGAVRLVG
jgi:hypothetical protein